MISVVNKYKYQGKNGYYVGRPSILGNPYEIGIHGTRAEVIEQYRTYAQHAFLNDVKWHNSFCSLAHLCEMRDIDLVCYCAPQACHADVLLEMLEKYLGKDIYKRMYI